MNKYSISLALAIIFFIILAIVNVQITRRSGDLSNLIAFMTVMMAALVLGFFVKRDSK